MHKTRTVKLKQLNGIQPSFILLFTPVCFFYCDKKASGYMVCHGAILPFSTDAQLSITSCTSQRMYSTSQAHFRHHFFLKKKQESEQESLQEARPAPLAVIPYLPIAFTFSLPPSLAVSPSFLPLVSPCFMDAKS